MRGFALFILMSVCGVSHADNSKARELFQQAQTKYNLLHFDEALKLFERAYEEKPDPVFLFNIAQCQRQLAQYELAAKSYRAYLVQSPEAPNRADVVARIQDMERAMQEKRAAAPPQGVTPPTEPPPAGTTPPTEPPPPESAPVATPAPHHGTRTLTIVGASLTALGGAALIGGLASGLVARGRADSVTSDARNGAEFDPNKESSGNAAANASYALYAVGAVAAATGVVLLVLDWRNHRGDGHAALGLHLAAAGATR